MSSTRKVNGKNLLAAKTGVEYGLAGGGGTSFVFGLLGVCVSIPQPIGLAVSGLFAFLCCLGGYCNTVNKADINDLEEANHLELVKMEKKLDSVLEGKRHKNGHATISAEIKEDIAKANIPTSGLCGLSLFSQKKVTTTTSGVVLTGNPIDLQKVFGAVAPGRETMDGKTAFNIEDYEEDDDDDDDNDQVISNEKVAERRPAIKM